MLEPLYPGIKQLDAFNIDDYPNLKDFLNNTSTPDWAKKDWLLVKNYLDYIARNKSEHTFNRYRNEAEKFLLWLFLIEQKELIKVKRQTILAYIDFLHSAPIYWFSNANHDRFIFKNGYYVSNNKWKPLKSDNPKIYKPSQQSLNSIFASISGLYTFLINEDICTGNPAFHAKKDCKYFIVSQQVTDPKRFTEEQWLYILSTATELADKDTKHERSLFVIAALKTLFLRISELSERPQWSPTMSDFWQDSHYNWWLRVFGKGKKIRDISVPDAFLPYLTRYRLSRSLTKLPSTKDKSPLVEKIHGKGGMTTRQLTRIVRYIFDAAYEKILEEKGSTEAHALKDCSTHWLRHTGASMEIERGRNLKDVSMELGHSSMATTDNIYIDSENKIRAKSGKNRNV